MIQKAKTKIIFLVLAILILGFLSFPFLEPISKSKKLKLRESPSIPFQGVSLTAKTLPLTVPGSERTVRPLLFMTISAAVRPDKRLKQVPDQLILASGQATLAAVAMRQYMIVPIL